MIQSKNTSEKSQLAISDALDIVCDLFDSGLILVADDSAHHLENLKKQISLCNMLKRTHFFLNGDEVVEYACREITEKLKMVKQKVKGKLRPISHILLDQ